MTMQFTRIERGDVGSDFRLLPDPGSLSTGFLCLRWCLGRDMAERLKQDKATQPNVLVVVVDADEREQRYLYALDHVEAMISFRRPGAHRVYGFLITQGPADRYKDTQPENFLLSQSRYYFEYKVFRDREKEQAERGLYVEHIGYDVIDVAVDGDLFAKPRKPWVEQWVNHMFGSKPVDECAFRKRAIWAFTGQLVLVPLMYVVITAIAFAVGAFWGIVCAARGVDWAAARSLYWHASFRNITGDVGSVGSAFAEDERGRERAMAPFLRTLAPVWIVPIFVVGYGLDRFTGMFGGLYALVFLAGYAYWFFMNLPVYGKSPLARVTDWQAETSADKLARRAEEARAAHVAFIENLACDGTDVPKPIVHTARNVPYIVWRSMKLAVCRPFAE